VKFWVFFSPLCLEREGLILFFISLTSNMKTMCLSVMLTDQKILIVSEGKLYHKN